VVMIRTSLHGALYLFCRDNKKIAPRPDRDESPGTRARATGSTHAGGRLSFGRLASYREILLLAKPAPPKDIGGRIKSHSSRAIRVPGGRWAHPHTHLQRVGTGRLAKFLVYTFSQKPPFSLFFGAQHRKARTSPHPHMNEGGPGPGFSGFGVRDRAKIRLMRQRPLSPEQHNNGEIFDVTPARNGPVAPLGRCPPLRDIEAPF